MEFVLKLNRIEDISSSMKRFYFKKPDQFTFVPGHSAILSINKDTLLTEFKPFTFTSTNDDTYLEFVIKSYTHSPITQAFHELRVGDEVIMHAVFGSMRYTGPGVFIAGGTGITPFVAILRQLKKENALEGNTLIYVAKTSQDVLWESELKELLKDNLHIFLTQEQKEGYQYGRPTQELLTQYVTPSQSTYVCGPPHFSSDMKSILHNIRENSFKTQNI